MNHLLSIEKLSRGEMEEILVAAAIMKRERGRHKAQPLAGQTWALIFSKSSTRTRVSFEVGVSELGGRPMFLSANDIQMGRGEPVKDTARVMGRMIHGGVFRTFAQRDVEEFAHYAKIPTINALTDEEHPCQILADIFTIEEKRGPMAGKVVTFVGDGACNVANSWIWTAGKLGFELRRRRPGERLGDKTGPVLVRDLPGFAVLQDLHDRLPGGVLHVHGVLRRDHPGQTVFAGQVEVDAIGDKVKDPPLEGTEKSH